MLASIRRKLLGRVPVRFYERAVFFSLYRTHFASIEQLPRFAEREALWADLLEQRLSPSARILYLEFGVWKGDSIRHNATLNANPDSQFIGFDTFEGLPEDWVEGAPRGHFSVDGQLPKAEDDRIRFVKGKFQDTLVHALQDVDAADFDDVVVHVDADLYSSTLYCLTEVSRVIPRFSFIFDEFLQDEGRALYNYQQAYGATVEFYGSTPSQADYCMQVTGVLETPAPAP